MLSRIAALNALKLQLLSLGTQTVIRSSRLLLSEVSLRMRLSMSPSQRPYSPALRATMMRRCERSESYASQSTPSAESKDRKRNNENHVPPRLVSERADQCLLGHCVLSWRISYVAMSFSYEFRAFLRGVATLSHSGHEIMGCFSFFSLRRSEYATTTPATIA